MSKKPELGGGLSGKKGKPLIHNEVKEKMNLSLTPTCKNNYAEAAAKCNLSVSEFIERLGRSKFPRLFSEENNYFGNDSK